MQRLPFMDHLSGRMRTCQNRVLTCDRSHMFGMSYWDTQEPVIGKGLGGAGEPWSEPNHFYITVRTIDKQLMSTHATNPSHIGQFSTQ
jgi:hypothetical protein